MNILEQLGISTRGIEKTLKPFESWQESPVKDWTITMRMLTIGEYAEIGKMLTGTFSIEQDYLTKIYVLAKSLVAINGLPLVTDEELAEYNHNHDLTGKDKKTLFEYKILHIKKLTEAVINKLINTYDDLSQDYFRQHIGSLTDTEQEESNQAQKSEESAAEKDKNVTDDSAATETTPE